MFALQLNAVDNFERRRHLWPYGLTATAAAPVHPAAHEPIPDAEAVNRHDRVLAQSRQSQDVKGGQVKRRTDPVVVQHSDAGGGVPPRERDPRAPEITPLVYSSPDRLPTRGDALRR